MNNFTKTLKEFGFKKLERRIDGNANTASDVISFPRQTGGTGKLDLPPSKIAKPNELAALLADHDAKLPDDSKSFERLLTAIKQSPTGKPKRFAGQNGWNTNRTSFVAQSFVFGEKEVGAVGLRNAQNAGSAGIVSRAGTADGWRDTVGVIAEMSTCAMFSVSLALAAPLLVLTRRPAFSVNFFGPSRSGKTICTLAAASLNGLGTVQDLPSWVATNTGLEELLPNFRDMLFVIDDLMSMEGSEKDRYQRINSLSYTLATGRAKIRAARYSADQLGSQTWRTILLTQSEKSVKSEADALTISRNPGSSIRLIDIPAVFTGKDVFDRATGSVDHIWSDMAKACEQNHGAAFERYIGFLIAERDELSACVEQHGATFVAKVAHDSDTRLVRDLAAKCGIVYAGAMLGIEADVVRWKKDTVLDAVKKCFFGARELLPDDSKLVREGLRELASKLKAMPIVRPGSSCDVSGLDGYRFAKLGIQQCLVRVEEFNSWFPLTKQRALVLESLVKQGKVELASQRKGDMLQTKPKEQFVWADKARRRSFLIKWAPHRTLRPVRKPR